MIINIFLLIFYIISSFTMGVFSALIYIWKKNKNEISKIELLYLNIFKDIKDIEFMNRIGQNVHFKTKEYMLVYSLDKKEVLLFKEDSCVATSDYIDKKLITDIIEYIENNFKKEIYEDIINVGGYIVSKDYMDSVEYYYVEEEGDEDDTYDDDGDTSTEEKPSLNLDDILDKINKKGIKSLTKDEAEFLKNYRNNL